MTALAFDTHAAANTLEKAGFTKAQVEALVEVTRLTSTSPDISALATKSDLQILSAATKSDLQILSAATKSDLQILSAELTRDLTVKIDAAKIQGITMVLSGVGVMLAIVTVLIKAL